MATTEFTKKEAVRIVTSAAKDYQDILSGIMPGLGAWMLLIPAFFVVLVLEKRVEK